LAATARASACALPPRPIANPAASAAWSAAAWAPTLEPSHIARSIANPMKPTSTGTAMPTMIATLPRRSDRNAARRLCRRGPPLASAPKSGSSHAVTIASSMWRRASMFPSSPAAELVRKGGANARTVNLLHASAASLGRAGAGAFMGAGSSHSGYSGGAWRASAARIFAMNS